MAELAAREGVIFNCDVNTWLVRYHGFFSETGRYFLISVVQRQTGQ